MSADLLKQQYNLVKGSRQVLFDYCETLSQEDFTKELPEFGHGSVRNTLGHIANTYIHWVKNFALSKLTPYVEKQDIQSMADVHRIFEQTDAQVDEFITRFHLNPDQQITGTVPNGKIKTLTPAVLFTHVITHEFHHKGQILAMSRAMDYIPVDTDVIR